jgi:pimeloyl-CoA synthetase
MSTNHLAAGWTWDKYAGAVLQFEHLPLAKAKRMERKRDRTWVVETINWTLADEGKSVHYNRYYANGLTDALALAARFEMFAQIVAESVVNIRPATSDEADSYYLVDTHYEDYDPDPITLSAITA